MYACPYGRLSVDMFVWKLMCVFVGMLVCLFVCLCVCGRPCMSDYHMYKYPCFCSLSMSLYDRVFALFG